MYEIADIVPNAELSPGSNLLVTGPPLTGKRELAVHILAQGIEGGEGAIAVTSKNSSDSLLDAVEERVNHPEPPIRIVDCVTKQRGMGAVREDHRVEYVDSPVDMTGIGIAISNFLEELYVDQGLEHNRILTHSLSPLLLYSNLETVFRFLHVFTGRVESADALGIYVIDSSSHDERTMGTLKQLFDAAIEVQESDDGTSQLRLKGALS